MRKLEDEIRHHQSLYYAKNQPVITDRQFDKLLEELITLEKENPDLVSADTPSKVVGSDLDNSFPKFKHTIPVLSLGNTYSTEEAIAWAEKTVEDDSSEILIEWKVDGATLVLYYENGNLARAVTRGTGQTGDVVTQNAITIRGIPQRLTSNVTVTVRGEAYMTYDDFESFNESQGGVYANPRNLVSGSLKHKKSRETASRPIRWGAFEAYFTDEKKKAKAREKDSAILEELNQLGLPTFPDWKVVKKEGLSQAIEQLKKKLKGIPFPVDGLVLKLNDIARRQDLGFTAASPRWATALKFEPELAETTVEDIEVFTGRTGRVTPRARLQPVQLAGTTVTYATLHNSDYIERLGVRIGSRVKVSKRGEIIPAVEEVVDPGSGPPFVFPKKCPACGSKLVRDEDAADWLCANIDCDEKKMNSIIFFGQRKQMDIQGLGEKTIENLYKLNYIKEIPDLYDLKSKKAELEKIEGFGEKSIQIMLDGIEKSKEQPFEKVLPSLGLRDLGHSATEILLENGYADIDKIIKLASGKEGVEGLQEIHGIGPTTAESIIAQFQDKRVLDMISKLRKHGLRFAAEIQESNLPQIFADQAWCVTGSFEKFKPRDLAMKEVKARGGKTVTSVSSKTTHLLAGEGAGSKLKEAEKHGTKVVTEKEFLKLIGSK